MSNLDVRIEELAPMRVAQISINSSNPEAESMNALLRWAKKHDLQEYRIFGYDNCQPEPNHNYTSWLTVSGEVLPEGDIQLKDIPGGRYAVTRVTGVENIGKGWDALMGWLEQSSHQPGKQQSLEEMLSSPGTPLNEIQLDLNISLAE